MSATNQVNKTSNIQNAKTVVNIWKKDTTNVVSPTEVKSYGLYDLVSSDEVKQVIKDNPELMDFSEILPLIANITKKDIDAFFKKHGENINLSQFDKK
jgi:muconolactone delta-isomerase